MRRIITTAMLVSVLFSGTLILTNEAKAQSIVGCSSEASDSDNANVSQITYKYCALVDANRKLTIQISTTRSKYYWGFVWYSEAEYEGGTIPVSVSSTRSGSNTTLTDSVVIGRFNPGYAKKIETSLYLPSSGDYTISVGSGGNDFTKGTYLRGYWYQSNLRRERISELNQTTIILRNLSWNINVPTQQTFSFNILNNIEQKLAGTTPKAFYFAQTAVPAKDNRDNMYDILNPGVMIVIPQAGMKNTGTSKYTNFRLLQDLGGDGVVENGTIPSNSCETSVSVGSLTPGWFTPKDSRNNLAAIRQFSEVYTPDIAWKKLGTPDIAINANYFDTRTQINDRPIDVSTTVAIDFNKWQLTKCSSPLGIYYQNINGKAVSEMGKRHISFYGNKNLAGSANYVLENGQLVSLDTFFIYRSANNNEFSLTVNDVYNSTNNITELKNVSARNNKSLARAQYLETYNAFYLGVSGTSLIPPTASALSGVSQPDLGTSATTRIAIGYDSIKGRFLIFQGGNYGASYVNNQKKLTGNGVTRAQLADIMRAMGATSAMELDGGGSAAVVIKDYSPNLDWVGDRKPATSCPDTGAWCSPVTQPTGGARPIPSWMGISFETTQVQ